MFSILINWIVSAMVVFSIAYILPGATVVDFTAALVVALALGVINALLKPVLLILTLPINILTLGLFTFVLNALLIILVSNIVPGFTVDGFLAAFVFGIVLSVVNAVVNNFLP
ncbi:MAG: phage holin family protein [Patescibacteria group bacterium]